jgi:O-antigen ligase
LVALAPLPLGSARPLAWDALSLVTAALLYMSLRLDLRREHVVLRKLAVPAALFSVVIAFVVFQIIPLTPESWHNPVWGEAGAALGQSVVGSIAVDRQVALADLLRLATYAGVCAVAIIVCTDGARARTALRSMIIVGTGYAVYGLIVYWSGSETILWFKKWAYAGDLSATFVNRNSAAAFFGLCSLCALAELSLSLQTIRLYGTWHDYGAQLIEQLSRRIGLLLAIFLTITACVLTHSRGGLFSTVIGWIVLGVGLRGSWGGERRRALMLLSALIVALAATAVIISGGLTFERAFEFINGPLDPGDGRLAVYGATIRAISDHPLLGTGLGSFVSVFPYYRPDSVVSFYDLAHNDYLQNMLELGIPAALCLFIAVAWLIGLCVRGLRVRQRYIAFPALGLAASALVCVHSLMDFSLQIPAITVTYMLLLGIGVAQSLLPRTSDSTAS